MNPENRNIDTSLTHTVVMVDILNNEKKGVKQSEQVFKGNLVAVLPGLLCEHPSDPQEHTQ